jgi:hypothetical protein
MGIDSRRSLDDDWNNGDTAMIEDVEERDDPAPGDSTPSLLGERTTHVAGPYYVAPDSAEPLPERIWARIPVSVLEEAIEASNESRLATLPIAERGAPDATPPSIFRVTKLERELLVEIGGNDGLELLKRFDELDQASGLPVTPRP